MKITKISTTRGLRVVGLFAGIGGIELGLHKAGHETIALCEIDPGARAVLEKRFAGVPVHGDICSLRSLPSETDMMVAGFPCQDLSQAGKTAGIEGSRSGLVGEVFRLLRRKRVDWVLLENVPFMLRLSQGRAMEVIVASLEELGYRWAYRVVNSQAFGLPQRRERVYLLASRKSDPRTVLFADEVPEPEVPEAWQDFGCGFYWTEGTRGLGWAVDAIPTLKGGSSFGIPSPPAIVRPNGLIVTPNLKDAERLQGFPPDWTLPAGEAVRSRLRWRMVGNAVTVPVAEWIGERLRTPDDHGLTVPGEKLQAGDPWPRAAWNTGEGRHGCHLSAWPRHEDRLPLILFLKFPASALSYKATAGFLDRAENSSLRFPPGFLKTVRAHRSRMRGRLPTHDGHQTY